MPAPENTLAAIAYDLASFLTFLWHHRQPLGKRSWRDTTPEDRAAYHRWRRIDGRGPGVKGSTWGREVATVNSFYRWAVESDFVEQNPIWQRPARDHRWHRHAEAGLTPAESPKDAHREDLAWLPPRHIAAGVTLVFAGICPRVYRISRFGAATPPVMQLSAI